MLYEFLKINPMVNYNIVKIICNKIPPHPVAIIITKLLAKVSFGAFNKDTQTYVMIKMKNAIKYNDKYKLKTNSVGHSFYGIKLEGRDYHLKSCIINI